MNWVTVAVYAGLILVLIGPAIGTYLPIRNARTPAARQFLVRVAGAYWVVALGFGVLPILLAYHHVIPDWGNWGGVAIFLLLFPIPWINRRVKELETRGHIPDGVPAVAPVTERADQTPGTGA